MRSIFLAFICVILLVSYTRPPQKHDEKSLSVVMKIIADKRNQKNPQILTIGKSVYQNFNDDEADILHLLGQITGYNVDCLNFGYIWNRCNVAMVDSILKWYDKNRSLIDVDSINVWLLDNYNYLHFTCTPEFYNDIMICSSLNWNDSITDDEIKRVLLNKDGTWKDYIIDANWHDLPSEVQDVLFHLRQILPDSYLLKNKIKLDSLELRYNSLEDKFKR